MPGSWYRLCNPEFQIRFENLQRFQFFVQFCGSEMSKMEGWRKILLILNHLKTYFLCKKKSRVVRSQFWKICWPSGAKKLFFTRIFEIIGYRCFYWAGESVLWALDFFFTKKIIWSSPGFQGFSITAPNLEISLPQISRLSCRFTTEFTKSSSGSGRTAEHAT